MPSQAANLQAMNMHRRYGSLESCFDVFVQISGWIMQIKTPDFYQYVLRDFSAKTNEVQGFDAMVALRI